MGISIFYGLRMKYVGSVLEVHAERKHPLHSVVILLPNTGSSKENVRISFFTISHSCRVISSSSVQGYPKDRAINSQQKGLFLHHF